MFEILGQFFYSNIFSPILGSRDHEGKPVLLIFTASSLWKNQQIVSTDLARLVMYYHSVPRYASSNIHFLILSSLQVEPSLQIRGAVHVLFFLFPHKNICCGYSLEAPQQGASFEYPQLCFCAEIRKISILFY